MVAAAAAAASATAFSGTFQFDDFAVIVGDPRVASLEAWWRSMPGIRPLLKLSYAANHASGLGLAGFHAVNVAVHVGAAVLALALLRRLERLVLPAPGPAVPLPPAAAAAALLGALLFALHPAQTEAVTYVSGRSTALAALLALAALVAWLDGRERGRPWLVHGLSPLCMALSLGVKELAVVLPAALLLLAAADGRRRFAWRAALRDAAAHWAVLALGAAAFAASPTYRRMLAQALDLRPPLENLRVQLGAVAWLAGQAVRPDRLLADPVIPPLGWPAALGLGAALLLAAAWALAALRGRPPAGATPGGRAAGLAILWTLLWLAPAGWWLPRPEPANDRQLYLAVLGPGWLLGRRLAAPGAGRAARMAVVLGLLVVLGGLSLRRSLVYRDEVTFWVDVARKAPTNARAFNNLGDALARCGRLAEAEAAFAEALAVDPGYARAGANLRLLREGALVGPDDARPRRCPP
jgi:tetratricopeptide (TPR) repeat protein